MAETGPALSAASTCHNPERVPFIDRLGGDAATYHVDYVLIDGGRNDLGEPPELVVAAADEYIKQGSLGLAEGQDHRHASRLRHGG